MRLVLAATALCAAAFVVVSKVEPSRTAPAPPHHVSPRPLPQTPRNRRPPQFVVVSFDGSGGIRLWPYWRSVARRAGAHFTFFVSGVYLLPERLRRRYHPPRHRPGTSDIWFARPDRRFSAAQVVRRTLAQIAAAYREGHEIGTHFNGHFCEPYPGNVDEWTAADWRHELDEFDRLLFHDRTALPFGPREIVGERTPCLQGRLPVLYSVLARRGFRYDTSALAPLGSWPRRRLGIWSVPLLELPFPGHTFRVVSMDYNLFANQTSGISGPASLEPKLERETYQTLMGAFRSSYRGNRAPLVWGSHFETWNHWAYDRALTRFLLAVCRRPQVRWRATASWSTGSTRGEAARRPRRSGGRAPRAHRARDRG